MNKSICIVPGKPEVAFEELHKSWQSQSGTWRVVANVESVDSRPKYKVRTVTIFKRNAHTLRYVSIQPGPGKRIPDDVLAVYDKFISLANEVR